MLLIQLSFPLLLFFPPSQQFKSILSHIDLPSLGVAVLFPLRICCFSPGLTRYAFYLFVQLLKIILTNLSVLSFISCVLCFFLLVCLCTKDGLLLIIVNIKMKASFHRLLFKQEGTRADWEYPFAVAGINVTFMLIRMLDLSSGL